VVYSLRCITHMVLHILLHILLHTTQVVLLSSGRMMYSGVREGLVPWFVEGCGYPYDPAMHGLASDWVMDLVNIGFTKPVVSS
jgi:hypothetical protein